MEEEDVNINNFNFHTIPKSLISFIIKIEVIIKLTSLEFTIQLGARAADGVPIYEDVRTRERNQTTEQGAETERVETEKKVNIKEILV